MSSWSSDEKNWKFILFGFIVSGFTNAQNFPDKG